MWESHLSLLSLLNRSEMTSVSTKMGGEVRFLGQQVTVLSFISFRALL